MKKILVFRTDRIGDFILTKKSINNLLYQKDKYKVDIITSEKNFTYVKNFNSFNKIYIYKKNLINFFLNYREIFFAKYDFIIIYDGKKRSFMVSMFLKGKKISFVKSTNLFYLSKFLNISTHNNSKYNFQMNEFKKIYSTLNERNIGNLDFYFDYDFKKISLPIPTKNYFILHLDEKWFKEFYYNDWKYCAWSNSFFDKIIKKILDKFGLPIIITTGNKKIPFIENIKKENFNQLDNKIYRNLSYNENLYLIDNVSFRELESVVKRYCKILFCCEGALSHVSFNLNKHTIALVESDDELIYRHWTGHMKKMQLFKRGDQEHVLNCIDELDENMFS